MSGESCVLVPMDGESRLGKIISLNLVPSTHMDTSIHIYTLTATSSHTLILTFIHTYTLSHRLHHTVTHPCTLKCILTKTLTYTLMHSCQTRTYSFTHTYTPADTHTLLQLMLAHTPPHWFAHRFTHLDHIPTLTPTVPLIHLQAFVSSSTQSPLVHGDHNPFRRKERKVFLERVADPFLVEAKDEQQERRARKGWSSASSNSWILPIALVSRPS